MKGSFRSIERREKLPMWRVDEAIIANDPRTEEHESFDMSLLQRQVTAMSISSFRAKRRTSKVGREGRKQGNARCWCQYRRSAETTLRADGDVALNL